MKLISLILSTAGLAAVCVLTLVTVAGESSTEPSTTGTDQQQRARLERGRYLTYQVGLCIDCHSPRDARGEHIEHLQLMGAPIPFVPTVPMPWSPAAPRIAGLPAGHSEDDLTHFLVTGQRPNNLPPPLPPMPPYRMNSDDARAVAAYLHSLSPETR
jgi:hypothetical protein